MLKHSETFDHKDGILFLKTHTTFSDDPKGIIHWYPFCRFPLSECEHVIGKRAIREAPGLYYCEGYVNGPGSLYRLESGGQTLPKFSQHFDVPRPNSVKQLRWHNGEWQKLLKKGWVSA